MSHSFLILYAFVPILALGQSVTAERVDRVRAWFEDVSIPTYALYPDDVNPRFFELENVVIYPYTMQDNLSTTKTDRTYKAAFLENEYLRVMCLPELGGRIQSVYDKRRGEEMFYRNRVIKPGLIALRGAWVSGGIEWNRGPTGHTVTSFSPVDVVAVENPDGSASLVIGNTEMNFRTVWMVRLTLRPDRAFLEEQISISNPTDGFHPYYFWNNTAFPNRKGTRFIYPMSLGTDHDGKNFFTWPTHEGRDLSWLKNYPDPTSIFAYECEFDFFGAYDVDRDYGVIQVANHHLLPGKKAWTWGNSDSGLASQSVLTDADGPYIEVQSGPLPTQADYGMLAPGQEISWREWWYPVFGLGQGFEFATKDVAVERIERENRLEFRMISTAKISSARLALARSHETLLMKETELTPEAPILVVVEGDPEEPIELRVMDREGTVLLSYRSPLEIPQVPVPSEHGMESLVSPTVENAYLEGQKLDRQMNRVKARQWYERALGQDPGHTDSLVSLAVLDNEAGLYESAAERLEKALTRDPHNGMAFYLLGVTNLRQGKFHDAMRLGYQATKLHGTLALGYGLVGRAKMRQGDTAGALEAFTAGYESGNTDELRLFEQMLVALYAAGDVKQARDLAREAVQEGTTRLVSRAVLALAGEVSMDRFVREARDLVGEDEFVFSELSLFFADLGLLKEAARLLSATLVDKLPHEEHRPLPFYTLAYYESLLGDQEQAREYLEIASRLSRDYVFASRPETIPVLQFAHREKPDDGRALLYLGNLYAGLGRLEEAVANWESAAQKNPEMSVAYRNLGLYRWKKGGDLSRAAELYQKAIRVRPADQALYRDLARILVSDGRRAEAIQILESMPVETRRRADVTTLLVRTYVEAERYDDAIRLLDSTAFSNWEGERDVWSLYSKAHIERGMLSFQGGNYTSALADFELALIYPANLNVGRPSQPREARAWHWKGNALDALGRIEEAKRAWRAGADQAPSDAEQIEYINMSREKLSEPR